jgi:hypothetical protein
MICRNMTSSPTVADDSLPLLTFADAPPLNRWLDEHGATSPGVWLRFAKKDAAAETVSTSLITLAEGGEPCRHDPQVNAPPVILTPPTSDV